MYTNIMEMFRKFEEAQPAKQPQKKPEQQPGIPAQKSLPERTSSNEPANLLGDAMAALQQGAKEDAIAGLRPLIQKHHDKHGFLLSVVELLCSHQFPKEAVKLILPVYKPTTHGVELGYRLLQACVAARNKLMGSALLQNLRDSQLSQLDAHMLQTFSDELAAL